VKKTKGGNPGIVHERALQEGWPGYSLERAKVAFTFGEKSAGETRLKPLYSVQGDVYRCGIPENAWVGDDRKKFVGARPGNTDGFRAGDGLGQHLASAFIERHFRAMRIDEQICVDGDHAPCSR